MNTELEIHSELSHASDIASALALAILLRGVDREAGKDHLKEPVPQGLPLRHSVVGLPGK